MESSIFGKALNVGILAIETYFPSLVVDQDKLELFDIDKGLLRGVGKYTDGLGQKQMGFCTDIEDVNSLALTATSRLINSYNITYSDIGRLEVGTESMLDKSKSVKTVIMQLFEAEGNTNVEGVDSINACYGGTAALFNSLNWIESSSWDGRYALVVCADIAVYASGAARCTGGAGAVALLVGPDAPLALDSRLRATYMKHAYDFYKPDFGSEYPRVDGRLSVECYLTALDACYTEYGRLAERLLPRELGDSHLTVESSFASAFLFHSPFCKLVQKSVARLHLIDWFRAKREALAGGGGGGNGSEGAGGGGGSKGAGGGGGSEGATSSGGCEALSDPEATPKLHTKLAADSKSQGDSPDQQTEQSISSPPAMVLPATTDSQMETSNQQDPPKDSTSLISPPPPPPHGPHLAPHLSSDSSSSPSSPQDVDLLLSDACGDAPKLPTATMFHRGVEKATMQASRAVYDAKTAPSLLIAAHVGNLYAPSLYACLVSHLISRPASDLIGQRIVLFSYGSGLAASMFSLTVRADAEGDAPGGGATGDATGGGSTGDAAWEMGVPGGGAMGVASEMDSRSMGDTASCTETNTKSTSVTSTYPLCLCEDSTACGCHTRRARRFTLSRMCAVLGSVKTRLQRRHVVDPTVFDRLMKYREHIYNKAPLTPVATPAHLFSGTFYLTRIDAEYRRFYAQKPADSLAVEFDPTQICPSESEMAQLVCAAGTFNKSELGEKSAVSADAKPSDSDKPSDPLSSASPIPNGPVLCAKCASGAASVEPTHRSGGLSGSSAKRSVTLREAVSQNGVASLACGDVREDRRGVRLERVGLGVVERSVSSPAARADTSQLTDLAPDDTNATSFNQSNGRHSLEPNLDYSTTTDGTGSNTGTPRLRPRTISEFSSLRRHPDAPLRSTSVIEESGTVYASPGMGLLMFLNN